jgi:hypothetical protein
VCARLAAAHLSPAPHRSAQHLTPPQPRGGAGGARPPPPQEGGGEEWSEREACVRSWVESETPSHKQPPPFGDVVERGVHAQLEVPSRW